MSLILVSQPDPILRSVLCQRLTAEGHVTVMVPDGNSCMRALNWNIPDLLIADTQLPDLSSPELLHGMEVGGFGHLPKIMLFGQGLQELRFRAAAKAIVSWLPKPVNLGDFSRLVARNLEQNNAVAA